MRVASCLLVLLLLAGCATPETRLRAGLRNAGLSPVLAGCMAGRMVDRLDLLQLRRIAGLPKAADSGTLDQALYRLRALRDPEVLGVATSSAALCATGLAR